MSASQPIRVVVDYGLLSTSGTGVSTKDPFIVKTGILYAVVSAEADGGHIGVCNTTTSGGVGLSTIYVAKQDDALLRFAYPASSVVSAATTGTSTVLELDTQDTKLRVGDFVTVIGSSVADYNASHVQLTAIEAPQRWNDYKCKVTIDLDTSTGTAAFTGIATVAKSVIPVVYGETANGCDAFIKEVQLG